MTLVDLDGDGLADKVFKKDGKLYFRKRLYSQEVPFAFETSKHQITGGVEDFLKESSNGISLGLQGSFVVEVSNGLPAGWSTTTNYMTDINGDGLVDIVADGGAYFGKHIQGQTPSFSPINTIQTTVSEPNDTSNCYISSSMLGIGDCGGIVFDGFVDPDIACTYSFHEEIFPRSDTIPAEYLWDGCTTQVIGYKRYGVSPPAHDSSATIGPMIKSLPDMGEPITLDSMIVRILCTSEKDCSLKQHAPDFDAVRVWVAPYNDTVKVISSIRLVPDDTVLFHQSRYADGVKCSIEHNKECHISADGKKLASDDSLHLLLSHAVASPDSEFVDTIQDIVVSKDDILFFRLQSKENRSFDKVDWRVRIEAKNHTGHDSVYDRNKSVFNSDSDFVLTGRNLFQAPQDGHVWISGLLQYKGAGQPAKVVVKKNNTVIDSLPFSSDDSTYWAVNFHVNSLDTVVVRIKRTNNDNPQWPNIHFTPLLKFFPTNASIIKDTVYYYPQIQLDIKHEDSGDPFKILCRKYFGELYRGWGQFAYNGRGSNSTLIELSRLELPTWYTATSLTQEDSSALQSPVDTNDLDNSLSEAVAAVNNPLASVIDDSTSVVSWIEMTAYN